MNIGIIAAMKHEMDLIVENLENLEKTKLKGFNFYIGKLGNNNVVVVEAGVGKVNAAIATTLLDSEFDVSLVINTGIAGGIAPLKTKDVVIGKKLMYHDFDTTVFGYKYGQVPGLPAYYAPSDALIMYVKKTFEKYGIEYKLENIYSGDKFVTSLSDIDKVEDKSGAVEMEGCAVAQSCTRLGIDCLVLRYISDSIGAESQIDDYNAFEYEMAEKSASICVTLVKDL